MKKILALIFSALSFSKCSFCVFNSKLLEDDNSKNRYKINRKLKYIKSKEK